MKLNGCFFLFFLLLIAIVNGVKENEKDSGCSESIVKQNAKKKKTAEGLMLVGDLEKMLQIVGDVLKAKIDMFERLAIMLTQSINNIQEERDDEDEDNYIKFTFQPKVNKDASTKTDSTLDDKSDIVEKRRLENNNNNNIISTILQNRRRLQNNNEEATEKLEKLIQELTETIAKLSKYENNEKTQEGFIAVSRLNNNDLIEFKQMFDRWLNQTIISLRRELDYLKGMLANMQERRQERQKQRTVQHIADPDRAE